jgi:hypothetical protein
VTRVGLAPAPTTEACLRWCGRARTHRWCGAAPVCRCGGRDEERVRSHCSPARTVAPHCRRVRLPEIGLPRRDARDRAQPALPHRGVVAAHCCLREEGEGAVNEPLQTGCEDHGEHTNANAEDEVAGTAPTVPLQVRCSSSEALRRYSTRAPQVDSGSGRFGTCKAHTPRHSARRSKR